MYDDKKNNPNYAPGTQNDHKVAPETQNDRDSKNNSKQDSKY